MNRYIDLIQQTFDFPTKEFTVENNQLNFNGVNLMEIIETYGTPLKYPACEDLLQKCDGDT